MPMKLPENSVATTCAAAVGGGRSRPPSSVPRPAVAAECSFRPLALSEPAAATALALPTTALSFEQASTAPFARRSVRVAPPSGADAEPHAPARWTASTPSLPGAAGGEAGVVKLLRKRADRPPGCSVHLQAGRASRQAGACSCCSSKHAAAPRQRGPPEALI